MAEGEGDAWGRFMDRFDACDKEADEIIKINQSFLAKASGRAAARYWAIRSTVTAVRATLTRDSPSNGKGKKGSP